MHALNWRRVCACMELMPETLFPGIKCKRPYSDRAFACLLAFLLQLMPEILSLGSKCERPPLADECLCCASLQLLPEAVCARLPAALA
eukprot:1159048-Pelagomonas_calceolata.AAC.6